MGSAVRVGWLRHALWFDVCVVFFVLWLFVFRVHGCNVPVVCFFLIRLSLL